MVGAVQVDVDDRLPGIRLHLEEALVPEDPGVVDEDVHGPEGVEGCLHDPLAPPGGGHVVVVGDRLAARGYDLFDHLLRGGLRSFACTVPCAAEVVHDDLRAALRELQCVDPAQAAACAGDDGHPAVEPDLILRDLAVFEQAVVDDRLAGPGVDRPPDGLPLRDLPDQRPDGISGVEGSGEAAREPPDQLRFPWREVRHQRPAGEALGTQAVHDRFFETGHPSEFWIDVELEDVPREPVDQRLVGGRRGVDGKVGLPFWVLEDLRRGVLAAEAAVEAGEDRNHVRE